MSKNQFNPLEKLPDLNKLKSMIGTFEYRRMEIHELPEIILNNGLTKKCNSFILTSSGSTDGIYYSFIGIRPDKGGVADEHPFVFYYDYNDPEKQFGGIIDHGNWFERTIPLEPWQIKAMNDSGMTASFTYKQIPPGASGSLIELEKNGMLSGVSDQFQILIKNMGK